MGPCLSANKGMCLHLNGPTGAWLEVEVCKALSDAQLRRQVQKQISHVLFNAPLVARPSLPGSWGVAGGWGGCSSSLRFCLSQRQKRSANTCCFRPVEWKPSGVCPGAFHGYQSTGGQSLPWGQAST